MNRNVFRWYKINELLKIHQEIYETTLTKQ